MFKKIKLIVIMLAVNCALPAGAAAPLINKKINKLLWTALASGVAYASYDVAHHIVLEEITNDMPNLNWEKASKIRAALAAKAPAEIDRNVIKDLKLKDHAGAPFTYAHKDQAVILSESNAPDGVNGWSDFMYLRELSKIHNHQIQQRHQVGCIYYGTIYGGGAYYFLKKPSIKRGLAAYSMLVMGAAGLAVIDQGLRYRSELKADQFAIDALKSNNDLIGLQQGYKDLVSKRAKIITLDQIEDQNILQKIPSPLKSLHTQYFFDWVTQAVVMTDTCHEKRLSKVQAAIDDLNYAHAEPVSCRRELE